MILRICIIIMLVALVFEARAAGDGVWESYNADVDSQRLQDLLVIAKDVSLGNREAIYRYDGIMQALPDERKAVLCRIVGYLHLDGSPDASSDKLLIAKFWFRKAAKFGDLYSRKALFKGIETAIVKPTIAPPSEDSPAATPGNYAAIEGSAAVNNDVEEAGEEQQDSVIEEKKYVYSEKKMSLHMHGAGFIINKTDILTASHVIEGCSYISVKLPGSAVWNEAVVKNIIPEVDLAILHTSESFYGFAHLGDVREDYSLAIAGFSNAKFKLKDTILMDSSDIYLGDQDSEFSAHKLMNLVPSMYLSRGDSGAALIDDDGRVVGLVDSRLKPDYGVIATSASDIKSSLASLDIKFHEFAENKMPVPSSREFAVHVRCF